MFRATKCSSSGESTVSIRPLVYVTLCRWPILFLIFIYSNSLHVSSNHVLIIRRVNCINTTSGMCHCMQVTVWYAGLDGTKNFVWAQAPFYRDLHWSEGKSSSSLNLETRLKLEISFTLWLFLSRCDLQYLLDKLTIYTLDAAFNIIRRFGRILFAINQIEELHI